MIRWDIIHVKFAINWNHNQSTISNNNDKLTYYYFNLYSEVICFNMITFHLFYLIWKVDFLLLSQIMFSLFIPGQRNGHVI